MPKRDVKNIPAVRPGRLIVFLRLLNEFRQFHCNIIAFLSALTDYAASFNRFQRLPRNDNYKIRLGSLYPCLRDKSAFTPIEPSYFLQDTWAAGVIFKNHPGHHYDVGSSAITVGIISQFVPVTMVDIRSIQIKLNNLTFQEGSITALPFLDETIESLSCLCVVEHIGLGRYGDELDQWGSEKAIVELQRVLKPQGHLLVSVPVDRESSICFNAHRTYQREHIVKMFSKMRIVEEKYIYGSAIYDAYEPEKGFGTGLFHLQKL